MGEEHAVSLKLPTFWTSQPQVWFAQAEAQFNLRKIVADETKYYHVLSALDQATATRLLDLINNPPDDDKYQELKDRLLQTFCLSKRERASRLLHFRPLGDSKPSALMDEMLALLGDHPPCLFFEQLFLERLPEDIRVQLADADFRDHRQLARKADALWAARDMRTPITNSVQQNPPLIPEPSLPSATDLAIHVTQQRPQPTQSAKYKRPTHPADLCYYHRTFGKSARRCQKPCAWLGNEQAGRR